MIYNWANNSLAIIINKCANAAKLALISKTYLVNACLKDYSSLSMQAYNNYTPMRSAEIGRTVSKTLHPVMIGVA
jgi:hypothetical protein